jgi:transglutaminase-like putative cysteine protease
MFMNCSDPVTPQTQLAFRVGCLLEYQTETAAPILLKIEPYPDEGYIVLEENLSFGNAMHVERRVDSHGNATLGTVLLPGLNRIRYDAILHLTDISSLPVLSPQPIAIATLPLDVLMYTFPSRYCESDKLNTFAAERFGAFASGLQQAAAICDWTHQNIEYRYGSGNSSLSACETIARGYGVCRDFAHVMIALCRAIDMPARYVAGHVPLRVGNVPELDVGIDFHAYVEVYVNGTWHAFDPRHSGAHTARVKIAHGMDAIDAAIATFSGQVRSLNFQVWAYEVALSELRLEGIAVPPCEFNQKAQYAN